MAEASSAIHWDVYINTQNIYFYIGKVIEK